MKVNPQTLIGNKPQIVSSLYERHTDNQPLPVMDYPERRENNDKKPGSSSFIEVEGTSSHIRVHKIWRWVFGVVFILGKIFLIFAIYFYLENRHAQQEIEQLKRELEVHATR